MPLPVPLWMQIENMECRQTSEKAILVVDLGGNEWWVPRSLLHLDSAVQCKNDRGILIVRGWFAEKQGMGGGEYFED